MPASLTCLRCSGGMEVGFVIDKGDGNVKSVAQWVAGAPVKSWLGLKTRGRDHRQVSTWRCRRCGYLESYADELPQ
jgi:hypothetical protein